MTPGLYTMTEKILDFSKFSKTKFRSSKKDQELVEALRQCIRVKVEVTWIDEFDNVINFNFDPANPIFSLSVEGKRVALEDCNKLISCICMSDPVIAAEYTRLFEKMYEQLKKDTE